MNIKLVKFKDVNETLGILKESYESSKSYIIDEIRDDQIDEAKMSFEKLLQTKKAIEQMENLDVQV